MSGDSKSLCMIYNAATYHPAYCAYGPICTTFLHLHFHSTMNSNPRLLRVEHVFISQDDVKERASQVLFMRFVYRRCREVLVWLGQEDQNIKDAFECARYIHENALGRREAHWKSSAQFRFPPVPFANLSDSLRSLAQLTYRP